MRSEQLRDLRELVQVNKKLVIAVLVCIAGLLSLQGYIGAARMECLGIADSKETLVSFETPVVVKRIFVLPGQSVKKGQPLVEVEPAEINLKLLEVQTQLEALRSEQRVRDTLLGSFSKKSALSNNPLATEVAGLQAQYDELKRQQSNAVRYAEEDGVVATVNYRPREQVQPFLPVITLTSNMPNLVYGFIHESRLAEFRVGDEVMIEPVAASQRRTKGKVVSIGNRITAFPERFQSGSAGRPTFFGRELIVSLAFDNQILIGEKVRVRAENQVHFSDLGFQAFADSASEVSSALLAEGVDLEAGGLLYMAAAETLLVASDETGPSGSPFWLMNLKNPEQTVNLSMKGLKEIEDVESLTSSGGRLYAMSSLTPNKKDKIKHERNLLIRFQLDGEQVRVDRALDFRTPFVSALKRQPLLRSISGEFEAVEVEAFSMDGADGYVALKAPQMPDGSTIVLKVRGLANQLESGRLGSLDMDVHAMVKLESKHCKDPARVSDIIKTNAGMLLLSNCKKSEKTGQVWWLADYAPQQQVSLITSLRHGRPEGMSFGADAKTLYVAADNGKKKGSDFLKIDIPVLQ